MARSDLLCVYCRLRPVDRAWRPFCSERCKFADLGRWLLEDYRVPDERQPDDPTPDPPLKPLKEDG